LTSFTLTRPSTPTATTKFWGETKEKRTLEDCHENTRAYIDFFRAKHRIIIPLTVREILDEEIVRKLA
jgi:hypothetical protein